ncbi:MAG: T9SS type A sorting domain-containing protein [Bacteroidota bacterium]|nr:T9SS type A sorting domain-containing protein [Bacteroidota bacterium]
MKTIIKIGKIGIIGIIFCFLAYGQEMKKSDQIQMKSASPQPNKKIQMTELMEKMRTSQGKGERRMIIQQMRKLRKQSKQENLDCINPETKNDVQLTRSDTLYPGKQLVSHPLSQPVEVSQLYSIPFASKGNSIELTVANGSNKEITNVRVEAANLPQWINVTPSEQVVASLNAGEETQAQFTFSVDKSAPINKEQILPFIIITATGEKWTKQIRISIAPPEKFELYQNYPNPFNPSTVIGYQLPVVSLVKLKVFDVLGGEITILVDESASDEKKAGYHETVFNADDLSSGVYYVRLLISDQSGKQVYQSTKKLLLTK